MAIDGYTIAGTTFVLVNPVPGDDAMVTLGYTTDGVEMNVSENNAEIFTDLLGPLTPQDFQNMGMVARIRAPLIAMDRSVLATITGRGDRTAVGQISTPGMVIGVSNKLINLGLSCAADFPWFFPYCIMNKGFGTKLATKANPFMVEFFAWPWVGYTATTAYDRTLWTRSIP